MRLPIIAGNWKMNTTVEEALSLVAALKEPLSAIKGVERVLCPPFISLYPLRLQLEGTLLKLGAQNLYLQDRGAYTGEISPLMLAPLCEYVIVGHSERRHYFRETDEVVAQKLQAALRHGLKPILCVGEQLEEREAGQTEAVVRRQLTKALEGVETPDGLVVAYEPVWAIGTGRAASGLQANEVIALIRQLLADHFGSESAAALRIQYGGSVTAANIVEFIAQPEIDGALVGGASLKAEEFVSIVSQTAAIKNPR